ncbi:hypothetical protein ACVWWQ_002114 [Rhodanobacter sp. TND4EL1]
MRMRGLFVAAFLSRPSVSTERTVDRVLQIILIKNTMRIFRPPSHRVDQPDRKRIFQRLIAGGRSTHLRASG